MKFKEHIKIQAYLYGSRLDTIVNFGWQYAPLYMEVTNNCKLNVKLLLEDVKGSKVGFIESYQSLFRTIEGYEECGMGKLGKTKTIGRFDIWPQGI